jgi:hypothetical protein
MPSGSFGNNGYLSGLMNYGAAPVDPNMSIPTDPNSLLPSVNYMGDNGKGFDLSGSNLGQMNYGMSPVGTDIASQFAAPAGGAGGGTDWMKMILGGTNADGSKTLGAGGLGLGALQGAASLFMGMQQYGLAKKQLAEGQRQFDLNYGAQKQTTNTRLEDRQRARVAANPNAYESVGSYMDKNGVK